MGSHAACPAARRSSALRRPRLSGSVPLQLVQLLWFRRSVQDSETKMSKGYAFVEYENAEQAKAAQVGGATERVPGPRRRRAAGGGGGDAGRRAAAVSLLLPRQQRAELALLSVQAALNGCQLVFIWGPRQRCATQGTKLAAVLVVSNAFC